MKWIIRVIDSMGFYVEKADFFTELTQVRDWTRRARAVWGPEAIITIRSK